jgi:cellobiose phosphorylase
VGRGGWTWYTGSASLSYRAALESVLGFVKRGDELVMNPCIPPDWREFAITYRHGSATYEILIKNPDGVARGIGTVDVDGVPAAGSAVRLVDGGAVHRVVIRMAGADRPAAEVSV